MKQLMRTIVLMICLFTVPANACNYDMLSYSTRPDELQLLVDTEWIFTSDTGTASVNIELSFGHDLRQTSDGSYGLDSSWLSNRGTAYYGEFPIGFYGSGYFIKIVARRATFFFYFTINGNTAIGSYQYITDGSYCYGPYDIVGTQVSGTVPPVTSSPYAPTLSWSNSDYLVKIAWTPSGAASGYLFSFEAATVGVPFDGVFDYSLDFDTRTEFSIQLWPGACYYISVQAYNDVGLSEFSNLDAVCLP